MQAGETKWSFHLVSPACLIRKTKWSFRHETICACTRLDEAEDTKVVKKWMRFDIVCDSPNSGDSGWLRSVPLCAGNPNVVILDGLEHHHFGWGDQVVFSP
jgi:hypothetical protein